MAEIWDNNFVAKVDLSPKHLSNLTWTVTHSKSIVNVINLTAALDSSQPSIPRP